MEQVSRFGDSDQLRAILESGSSSGGDGGGVWQRQLLSRSVLAAATWGHASAVELLLRARADPCGAADPDGATALHLAVRRGHRAVVELLLLTLPPPREFDSQRSRPRLLDARDSDGATPLAESCQAGRRELADCLLRAGADPNIPCSRFGRRPLHWAACAGDRALARLLLQAGADPAAVDVHGRTPAKEAEALLHYELARELKDAESWKFRPQADVVLVNLPEQTPPTLRAHSQSAPEPVPLSLNPYALYSPLQYTEPQSQLQPLSRHQPQQYTEPQSQLQPLSRHQPQQHAEPQSLLQLLSRQHQVPADTTTQYQPRIPSVDTARSLAAPSGNATVLAEFNLSQSHPASAFRPSAGPTAAERSRRYSDTPDLATSAPESPTSRWKVSTSGSSLGRPDAYPMNARPRGLCLVVSNERHFSAARLSDRPGTKRDVERIQQLFGCRFGFTVQVKADLTGRQMREVALAAARQDHLRADAFVCFLLGHGAAGGGVYGTDGELVPLAELAAAFDVARCPGLAGKPKVFFVQACRGAGEVVTAAFRLAPDGPQGPAGTPPLICPEGVDYLYGFACCEERVAYRCPESGSVYVQTLCDEIEHRLAVDGPGAAVDLQEALQVTTRRISEAELHGAAGGGAHEHRVYMVPEVRTTLRFRLRLMEG